MHEAIQNYKKTRRQHMIAEVLFYYQQRTVLYDVKLLT
jgi:hypothetical protein